MADSKPSSDNEDGSSSGSKVENLLIALNKCLDMSSNTSQSAEPNHGSSQESNNQERSYSTSNHDVTSDDSPTSTSQTCEIRTANGDVTTTCTNGLATVEHSAADVEKLVRDDSRNQVGKTDSGNSQSQTVAGGKPQQPVNEGDCDLKVSLAEKEAGTGAAGSGAAPCDQEPRSGEAGPDEAAGGEEKEKATEDLLARKLTVVMEKLEAYRATRDYMMALANRLKEENARYDTEHGVQAASGDTCQPTAGDEGGHNGSASNSDIELKHSAEHARIGSATMTKCDSSHHSHELDESSSNLPQTDASREKEICSASKDSQTASKGLSETGAAKSVTASETRQSQRSTANVTTSSTGLAQAETTVDEDDEFEYDDRYYDVSEDADYLYEEDTTDQPVETEVNLSESLRGGYNVTVCDPTVQLKEGDELSTKNINGLTKTSKEVTKTCENVSTASSVVEPTIISSESKSESSFKEKVHPGSVENDNKIISHNASNTVTPQTNADDTRSAQSVVRSQASQGNRTGDGSEALATRLAAEPEVAGLSPRSGMSKIQRMNVMIRLQAELARIQLQVVHIQDSVRAATTLLERLTSEDQGED